jgi:hypothetical protein
VLGIDIDELCEAAREYASRMTSNDRGDEDEVLDLLRKNDFEIEFREAAPVDGELVRTSYLRVVARRQG